MKGVALYSGGETSWTHKKLEKLFTTKLEYLIGLSNISICNWDAQMLSICKKVVCTLPLRNNNMQSKISLGFCVLYATLEFPELWTH